MYGPLAPQLDFAASYKQFNLPVLTSAHMADTHIVTKLREGREEDVRLCVGAGYCLDRIYVEKDALCLHNPATGREHRVGRG